MVSHPSCTWVKNSDPLTLPVKKQKTEPDWDLNYDLLLFWQYVFMETQICVSLKFATLARGLFVTQSNIFDGAFFKIN